MKRHWKGLVGGAVAVGAALLVLFTWLSLHDKPQYQGAFDVRLLGVNTLSNGDRRVSLALSNGTSRMFNVVDDITGAAVLTLEVPGRTRWLTRVANTGALNLEVGSNITTTVVVTNPPPQFRLLFNVHDLDAARSIRTVRRMLPRPWASRYMEWKRDVWNPTNPASPWIQ